MIQRAAGILDARGFADRFHGDQNSHLFIRGDLMQIQMEHIAAQGMVLNFLHQGQTLGTSVVLDNQIQQHVFRGGVVEQIGDFVETDFEILGFGLTAVNDGGHAARSTEFLDSAALQERARERFQCYRFHFVKLFLRTVDQPK